MDRIDKIIIVVFFITLGLLIIRVDIKLDRIEKLLTPIEGIEVDLNDEGGIDEIKNNTPNTLYFGIDKAIEKLEEEILQTITEITSDQSLTETKKEKIRKVRKLKDKIKKLKEEK